MALDNLAIRTLPLSAGAATDYALGFGLSGTNSVPDHDPDGDGDENFTEWLRAGDPGDADGGSGLLRAASSLPGEFRMNYYRLQNADPLGLTYTFRYTSNLWDKPPAWTPFTPEAVATTPVGSTHQLNLVRVPASLLVTHPQLFIQRHVH